MKKNKSIIVKKNYIFKTKIFIYLMVIWPIIHFLIFWLYVNIDTILLSFQRFDIFSGSYKYVGLRNFTELMSALKGYPDNVMIYAIKNSIIFFLYGLLFLLPLSIIAGYILYKKVFLSNVFRVVFFLPSILSVVVLTLIYKFMFDPNIGFITSILEILKIDYIIPQFGLFSDINTSFLMILLYCLWTGIGYNVVIISSALIRIPIEIVESAKLDGIGFFRELWSITLPLISPLLSTMVILSFSSIFTFFLQPMLLTGGRPNNATTTIMLYIVNSVKQGGNGVNAGATAGVFFSLFAIPLIMGTRKILDKLFPAIDY